MNQYSHTFVLDSQEKIVIFSPLSIDKLHCCHETIIIFLYQNGYYMLSVYSLRDDLDQLCRKLTAVLQNELIFDQSIQGDVGYVMNEKEQLEFQENEIKAFYSDISKYILWELLGRLNQKVDTWMYNALNGSIILQTTPHYPWWFEKAEQEKGYVPYDVWIQNYKPYFVRTISHKTAEQWLEQAQKMLNVIEENIKREFSRVS